MSKYQSLLPQLEALIEGETDLIANISNIVAALKHSMGFFWVGVYFVKGEQLVLGPFQGPVACTRIGFGKGVCGTAWKEKRSIIVDNVHTFPGHIACSSESRSEIVVPVFSKERVVAMVIDVDSTELADFDSVDEKYIKMVAGIIEKGL